MAPVEPSSLNSNAGPLAQFYTQVAVAGTLLAIICGNISNAHRNLPPAQHTRRQHTLHRRGIAIFASLALLGLALSAYFAIARRLLSYRQWAEQGSEGVPGTLWTGWYARTSDGAVIPREQSVWQLGRWAQDTNIWRDGDTVAARSSKAWWWIQQQLAASLAWSAYVGIESRRRNMPFFTIPSFVALSSLVSLNVAQNLFCIALLLTPENTNLVATNPSHDPRWAPSGGIQAIASVLPSLLLVLTPHAPSAVSLIAIQRWVVPMICANLPAILPKSLGHKFKSASLARRSYTPLFSVFAVFALTMHVKQSILALADNSPASQSSNFRFIWGTHGVDRTYSKLERGGIAAGKVLDVLHTHPAVASSAWDVLLSSVSFCVYAAICGTDPRAMLKYSLAPWLKLADHAEEQASPASAKENDVRPKSKQTRKPSTPSATAAMTSGAKAVASVSDSPQKRRSGGRGRHLRADSEDRITNVTTSNIIDDGDVPAASTRRSIRIKNADKIAAVVNRHDDDDEEGSEEEDVDESYMPSPATKRAVSNIVPSVTDPAYGSIGGTEAAGEAVALGWGMFVLGGLGVLCSSVLGADG